GSYVGCELCPGAAAARHHLRLAVLSRHGDPRVVGKRAETRVGDHLQIRSGSLALAGEVVTEEQRVGKVQRLRLQRPEVHLTTGGHPDLAVGAGEAGEREDAQAVQW